MPKDTTTSDTTEMGNSVSITAVRNARKASTLSEMWVIKSTPSKASKTAVLAVREKTTVARASSSTSTARGGKRELSQTTAVTEAVLNNLEYDTMGDSWLAALEPEFQKPYFIQLKKFLLSECTSNTVFPKIDDVYSWSRLTPFDQVKVIILGQDPYHDVGQAHGLSFSVLPPTTTPGSLRNIYKQLEKDIPGFKPPKAGDLSAIAKQGVLWLNTCLTVRAHKAGSHAKKGWEIFTAQVVRAVLKREDSSGVVIMAWGLPAQKTFASIGINTGKHLLLKSAHPSPLSAHKGFLGNGHFRKANEWLAKKYGKEAEVDWSAISAK